MRQKYVTLTCCVVCSPLSFKLFSILLTKKMESNDLLITTYFKIMVTFEQHLGDIRTFFSISLKYAQECFSSTSFSLLSQV